MGPIEYAGNFSDDLVFDTDQLKAAASEYRAAMEELATIKTDLVDGVNSLLASGWKSNAADAFSNVLMADWDVAVTRYYELMVAMSEAMDYAATQYELVQDELSKLRVNYG